MGNERQRMKDAARLAMLNALMRGKTINGDAVRRAFGGLDAALEEVFAIMNEMDAATRASLLLQDHDSMKHLIQSAQRELASA